MGAPDDSEVRDAKGTTYTIISLCIFDRVNSIEDSLSSSTFQKVCGDVEANVAVLPNNTL